MSDERHIELVWRCSSCSHQNLGRHMVCEGCGNPKDESEEYEMPSNTAAVASVEDEKLLHLARAGEHWRCAFCDSHQRALDGGCARCGAGRKTAAAPFAERPRAPPRREHFWQRDTVRYPAFALAFVFFLSAVYLAKRHRHPPLANTASMVVAPPPRTDFLATVRSAQWTRSIVVEQWKLMPHEGFTADLPPSALGIKAAGEHFHHDEDVFDHDETVYDDVEVPDGTRTETYSTRESCGEDCTGGNRTCRQVCTSKPQNCREVCSNKKNGFASCKQVCSGGGQDCHDECSGSERRCTTRYCDRTKTREVPKTRIEKRPRIVKKYRQVPRNAAWSTFKTWEWVRVRDAEETGSGGDLHWPDAGALSNEGALLADGGLRPGTERETRKETFQVTLQYEDGAQRIYYPTSADELVTFVPGAVVQTHIYGEDVTILRDGG